MEDNNRQELTERLIIVAEGLNRQDHLRRLDEFEDLNLTMSQIKTLVLLERHGPLRMGSISMHVGRPLSATTTVVAGLVKKRLVDRSAHPDDRRVLLCELTEEGRETIHRFWRIGSERIQMAVDLLDSEQLETFVRVLELILRAERESQH